jgi:L-threonylcarbamoyladenylate synthase
MDREQAIEILVSGGVGVMPTDTIYGIVGSAFLTETVERIYQVKKRLSSKPLIVLIADIEDAERFGVVLSDKLIEALKTYWPGPYSIILPCIDEEFEYLTRGTDSIAFRVPGDEELRNLLRQTGPLVAPSANIEGESPAKTVRDAVNYFGEQVDFYLDGDEIEKPASTIIRLDDDGVKVLRN